MKKIYVIMQQEYKQGTYIFTKPAFCFSRKGRANDQLDELVRQIISKEYWSSEDAPTYSLVSDENVREMRVTRRVVFKQQDGVGMMTFEIHALDLDNGYGI